MKRNFALVHFQPLRILGVYPFLEGTTEALIRFSAVVKEEVTHKDEDAHQLFNGTLYQIVEIIHQ